MSVLFTVLAARNVNPVVLAIGSLQDELVEIGMLLEEGEPMVGYFHVGMTLSVAPGGILGLGKTDIGCFTQGVLAGIDTSYLNVEGTATVAGTDDDGLSSKFTQGFEYGATKLLQRRDVLHRNSVVDTVLLSNG